MRTQGPSIFKIILLGFFAITPFAWLGYRATKEDRGKMGGQEEGVSTKRGQQTSGEASTAGSPSTPSASPAITAHSPAGPSREAPLVNSLGMKFVPVPGIRVLFSVWDTRVQDYAAYAQEKAIVPEKPDFTQGPTHPAVKVSWEDAKAFCAWLTERERKTGKLDSSTGYRLPTDREWSYAVGVGDREDATKLPVDNDGGLPGVYPWDALWPPPEHAGNYDQTLHVDDFENTSPVGSFAANPLGLYDLGGNVWQWCEDWYDGSRSRRVLRGASWSSSSEAALRSSSRGNGIPSDRTAYFGFRCVLAPVEVTAPAQAGGPRVVEAKPTPTPPALPQTPPGGAPLKTLSLERITSEDLQDDNAVKRFILHIPIKARRDAQIEMRDVVIQALFYDILDGDKVVETSANINSHWLTPPANWASRDTEELAVEYRLPKADSGTPEPGKRKYYGYLVRIYYRQQLQASAAEPERLSVEYPPPPTIPPVSDTAHARSDSTSPPPSASFDKRAQQLRQNAIQNMESPTPAGNAPQGSVEKAVKECVTNYLAAAAQRDSATANGFLAGGYKANIVAEFRAKAESGWKFSATSTKVTSASVNADKGTVVVSMEFRGGHPPTYMEMKRTFSLVIENGVWKIWKMEPPPSAAAPGVRPL